MTERRTHWSRLEPRARSDDMDDGLRAPVRDPMWLLSRQWQVGEFRGEDAGSPVDVSLTVAEDDLTRVDLRGGGRGQTDPFDYDGGPLEATVERERVTTRDEGPPLRTRVEAGQQFLRTLRAHGYTDGGDPYTAADFPTDLLVDVPDDPMPSADRRYTALVEGRALDGHAVADAVENGPAPTPSGGSATGTFDDAAAEYLSWYRSVYDEPTAESGSAWDPTRMEYDFAVATGDAGTETVFEAPEYPGGRLDWHAFDAVEGSLGAPDADGDPQGGPSTERTMRRLPTKVSFPGMPAGRWWELEDSGVSLGEVAAEGASLTRLLLVEFATQFGNDWFRLPVETAVGTCTRVTDLSVTDTFGVTEQAEPAADDDWRAYMHDLPGHDDPGLFVPPTLSTTQEAEPLEQVTFARDETANLVFAIERLVEGATGRPVDRTEFQVPRLTVDAVVPAEDPDSEYVRFANHGEDDLSLDGVTVAAERDGTESAVHSFTDRAIPPRQTLTLTTGQGDEGVSAGLTVSALSDADSLAVRDADGDLLVRHLLARPSDALADYRLATAVADYWYPFTMERDVDHGTGAGSAFRLARALLFDADTLGTPVEDLPFPQGEVLTPPEDLLPAGEENLRLYEEEVGMSGLEVVRRTQYARWTDGSAHLWVGRERGVGGTELSSGLAFDSLDERE